MKRYYLAAGALLLGTSALAWAADKSADPATGTETTAESKLGWWSNLDAKLSEAGLAEKGAGDKTILAEADATGSSDPAVQTKLAMAETGDSAAVQTKLAMADSEGKTGMGGPLEEGGPVSTAELTPRPATTNYPPCDPGPGDDNCIQLYEPGVRAQLASWDQPTGGLADHSATTAMGGPYEPVDDAVDETEVANASLAIHSAMNGDGVVDTASGETAEVELAHATAHQGVGGPVEAQSGYPPCDPGPGDDRCIQLYEPGVTGAGN